jgi:hypothetical protein
MQGGFSFCGVDIAKFGLEYVPPLDQTYVFSSAPYEVHQETFDAHHGGYFYGTTVQPKDFTLKCFYQDLHIAHGSLTAIENFFRRGRTGRLVFEQRDWLWYTATVIGVDLSDLRNYRNGFVTISLRAYYPFARHDFTCINEDNQWYAHIASNSGLLTEEETPVTTFKEVKSNKNLLLYNGGTERAQVAIAIAGNAGEGVTITNKTTGQTCKFVAFSKADTTDKNKYIVTDALNGKTVITDGTTSVGSFLYHDHGFIELDPSFPIERDVYASYTSGSNIVTLLGVSPTIDLENKFIFIEGAWHKILSADDNELTIDAAMSVTDSCYTNIVVMNEISVELAVSASLTKLDFIYKPTFQ